MIKKQLITLTGDFIKRNCTMTTIMFLYLLWDRFLFTFSSILLQQTNTEKDDEFIVPLEESKLKGIVKELKVTESKLSTVNDVTKIFRDEAGEEVEDICEHLVSPYHQNTREGLLPLWPLKPRGSTEKND